MICLLLLASGKNPPRCADILNISVNSIMTYEMRIRKKLGAKNRTQALFLALKEKYFQLQL
jgi:DNA-binding CsgD family transcriptional regulator